MTRDDILTAAAQVFSEKGFHGASMQDIAGEVNLQKASIYHHVSSKQEILFILLDQGLDILTEKVQNAILEPADPDEKLRRAICTYLTTITENQELAAVLLLEYRSLAANYLQDHIVKRDHFESIWRGLIEDGLQAQIFECDRPSISARALLGTLNWTVTWFSNDGPLTAEQIGNQYADLFLEGLTSRGINMD